MAWMEVKPKGGIEIVELHRPKELVYIMVKLFGFKCPPVLATVRDKKTGAMRPETIEI